MLPVSLVYEFQLLQRGIVVYCNNQQVKAMLPLHKGFNNEQDYYLIFTTQELVYVHPKKLLSLNMIENAIYQEAKWN